MGTNWRIAGGGLRRMGRGGIAISAVFSAGADPLAGEDEPMSGVSRQLMSPVQMETCEPMSITSYIVPTASVRRRRKMRSPRLIRIVKTSGVPLSFSKWRPG